MRKLKKQAQRRADAERARLRGARLRWRIVMEENVKAIVQNFGPDVLARHLAKGGAS